MVDATDEMGESLMRLLPPLRRAIVQAVRAAEGLPELPEAQVLMLRTLETSGPVTPGQLADELHLARPTVSNLVRELVNNGLLDRNPSEQDAPEHERLANCHAAVLSFSKPRLFGRRLQAGYDGANDSPCSTGLHNSPHSQRFDHVLASWDE